jgi:hypothetical protein
MTTDTATAPITVPLGRRLAAIIETGYHPATGQPTIAGETCGDCAHLQNRPLAGGGVRTKCGLAVYRRYGPNLPPATPACALYILRTAP